MTDSQMPNSVPNGNERSVLRRREIVSRLSVPARWWAFYIEFVFVAFDELISAAHGLSLEMESSKSVNDLASDLRFSSGYLVQGVVVTAL